jgi:hypothetical protein
MGTDSMVDKIFGQNYMTYMRSPKGFDIRIPEQAFQIEDPA